MILISRARAGYGRESEALKMMEIGEVGGKNLDIILKLLISRKNFH